MNLQFSFMDYTLEELYEKVSSLFEPVTLEEIKNHIDYYVKLGESVEFSEKTEENQG